VFSNLPQASDLPIVFDMASSGRLAASVRIIALLTLASRILGLIRESMFSHFFGTSELLSAFRVAFMAPNLARRLFGEGALSAAMVPVLTETLQTDGEDSSRRFVGSLLALLFLVLCAAVLLVEGVILGWRAFYDDPALELTAIMMPYMALICTVAVAGGVLNVRGRFGEAASAPLILNAGMIGALFIGGKVLGLSDRGLILFTCFAVLFSGVAQLVVTGCALRMSGFFPVFSMAWKDPRIRRVMKLMAPMILGLSAVPLSTLIDTLVAYLFIREGDERVGPAVLGYAQLLYQLPLGVMGVALATAIFPAMSEKAAAADRSGLADLVTRGIRLAVFTALPASVGLILVSRPLVEVVCEHGMFDAGDTWRVSATLVFYSAGIVFYFLQHVIVRAFYAMKDSASPARIALYLVVVDLVLNLMLVFPLEERGLALTTAICAAIQVAWLLKKLRCALPEISWPDILRSGGKTLVATSAMTLVLIPASMFLRSGTYVPAHPVVSLATLVILGAVVYIATAFWLRIDEVRHALARGNDLNAEDVASEP